MNHPTKSHRLKNRTARSLTMSEISDLIAPSAKAKPCSSAVLCNPEIIQAFRMVFLKVFFFFFKGSGHQFHVKTKTVAAGIPGLCTAQSTCSLVCGITVSVIWGCRCCRQMEARSYLDQEAANAKVKCWSTLTLHMNYGTVCSLFYRLFMAAAKTKCT